jgi:hypothetical protein
MENDVSDKKDWIKHLKGVQKAWNENVPLPVAQESPCGMCKHLWSGVRTDSRGRMEGLVLCHADNQYRDFSCFEEKP